MDRQAYNDAQTLWHYMLFDEPGRSADVLLVLGGMDERVAVYAAELTKQFQYGLVAFSGGIAHTNDLLSTKWRETEAEHFYTIF